MVAKIRIYARPQSIKQASKHLFQTIALVLVKIFWSMNQYCTSNIETPYQFKGQMWGVRADKGWDLLMETCPHTKYLDSKLEFWRYTQFTICIPDYRGCIDNFHIYYKCNFNFIFLSYIKAINFNKYIKLLNTLVEIYHELYAKKQLKRSSFQNKEKSWTLP